MARSTKSGKAGLIIGTITLVLWLAALLVMPARDSSSDRQHETITQMGDIVPPLGTITSGIGAEFTVPAGQVAVFEIVTRRDNVTVPVPPHCGYVMASPDAPLAGTCRWSRMPEEAAAGERSRIWSLEIRTSDGGRGYTGGLLLPEKLNAAVGARSLGLGVLEPNEEVIHWGSADANDLPANGLIALRVTVMAHGMKTGGSGSAHIDWKEAQSAQSTSRRKLPSEAP